VTADQTQPSAFAPGETAWREKLGFTRDVVRQELVTQQLAAHLPPVVAGTRRARVLDVGCGQGTQAIRLARAGYDVVGVDVSEHLLGAAAEALAREPTAVRDRMRLEPGELHQLGATDSPYRDQFDVVCCHGVVMYVPSLADAVTALAATARHDGIVSVLSRNRAGIAMRAGMASDWPGALAGFDAHEYGNRLEIEGARAYDPEELFRAFDASGLTVRAWYGVRLFTDHWRDGTPPEDFDVLLAAEAEAGKRDPYRRVAALTHTIGVRAAR
jgi:S-adenosylmethionine-dependent methyltransferase